MRATLGLVACSLWLCAVHGSPAADPLCAAAHLTVELRSVKTSVDLTNPGSAVKLAFRVFNPTSKPITLLKRSTPLEGIKTSMFKVTNPGGTIMQYRGKHFKRAQPGEHEYIVIPPRRTKEQIFTLREYELAGDGKYSFTFTGALTIKCASGQRQLKSTSPKAEIVIRSTHAHEERFAALQNERQDRRSALGGGRRSLTYSSCDASKQAQLVNWTDDAALKISAARYCLNPEISTFLNTTSSCSLLVDTWFGSSTTQSELASLASVFATMATNVQDSNYHCAENDYADNSCVDDNSTEWYAADYCGCDQDTFAFVYPSDTSQEIYMCPLVFGHEDYAEKVQTVVHELSHFAHIHGDGGTDDHSYGEHACHQLAQGEDAATALKTADNYGYFAIYTNVCYQHAPADYEAYVPPCKSCGATTWAQQSGVVFDSSWHPPSQSERTSVYCQPIPFFDSARWLADGRTADSFAEFDRNGDGMIDMFEFSNTSQFSTDPVGQPSTTNLPEPEEFAITWQSSLGGHVFHDEQLDINEGDIVKLNWSGGHNVYRAEGNCSLYSTLADFQGAPTYTEIEGSWPDQNPYTLASPPGAPATYCYACIAHWGSMRFTLRINQFQPESGQPTTQQTGQPSTQPPGQFSTEPIGQPSTQPVGQPSTTVSSVITCSGGNYPAEVGWSLNCSDGTTLNGGAPYGNTSSVTLAVALGATCTLNMTDSYGDGWNGNAWAAPGFGQNFSLANGKQGTKSFVVQFQPGPTYDCESIKNGFESQGCCNIANFNDNSECGVMKANFRAFSCCPTGANRRGDRSVHMSDRQDGVAYPKIKVIWIDPPQV